MTIKELFHVIDTCGRLLNKAELNDDDERPSQLFCRYSKLHHVDDCCEDEYYYVESSDVPIIIFSLFKDQPDQKRIDIAEYLGHVDLKENKHMMEHIVDQIWQ